MFMDEYSPETRCQDPVRRETFAEKVVRDWENKSSSQNINGKKILMSGKFGPAFTKKEA